MTCQKFINSWKLRQRSPSSLLIPVHVNTLKVAVESSLMKTLYSTAAAVLSSADFLSAMSWEPTSGIVCTHRRDYRERWWETGCKVSFEYATTARRKSRPITENIAQCSLSEIRARHFCYLWKLQKPWIEKGTPISQRQTEWELQTSSTDLRRPT